MPSKPQPLSSHVRVTHPRYGEKTVRRSRLSQLSKNWSRVPEKKSRRSTAPQPSAPAPAPATDPDQPDSDKE